MDVFLTGFPKKLLVAISILVLVTMCLTPTEARAVEHRRRHHRKQQENMPQSLTKETTAQVRRPKHASATRSNPTSTFKNSMRKIQRQLKVARRFFNQDKRTLNESRENRDGNPKWLPKVNFVDIHNHDYRDSRSIGILEARFTFLMPKLYKSLMEYRIIFELMRNVTIRHGDDKFYYYKEHTRRKLIENTLARLYPLITEITDEMEAVNMTPLHFDKEQMNLSSFDMHVDSTHCLRQDYIAFRGYGNLLNQWHMELKCPKKIKGKITEGCKNYELALQKKGDVRRKKRINSK